MGLTAVIPKHSELGKQKPQSFLPSCMEVTTLPIMCICGQGVYALLNTLIDAEQLGAGIIFIGLVNASCRYYN